MNHRSATRRRKFTATLTLRSTAIAVASACLLSACGAQGPPRPPRVEKPERVTDLAVRQVGRALVLTFTLPTLAADGQGLSKPLEIEIFRTVTPAGQKPAAITGAGAPGTQLPPGDVARYTRDERIEYPSPLSEQEFSRSAGSTVSFAVRGLTRGFRGRPLLAEVSNTASATLLDVSGPVEGLEVQTTEHALDLRWTAPGRTLTGGASGNLAGYHVYKSKTGKPDSFEQVAETADAAYQDHEFLFDRTYCYKVRAVFKQAGQTAESEDSKPAVVTPHDIFPPATPAGLTGLYTAGAVELIWTANSEPDLAGYNVYRRDESGPAPGTGPAAPQKLNHEFVGTPIFRDTSIEPRHKYSYRVTAVDLAKNESPPSAEVEVEVP